MKKLLLFSLVLLVIFSLVVGTFVVVNHFEDNDGTPGGAVYVNDLAVRNSLTLSSGVPITFGDSSQQASAADYGLSFEGTVTTYTSTTQFAASVLAGKGNDYFNGYYVYVVWDAAGAAPQGEKQLISDYTSSGGVFVHTAFSTPLAEGDKVLIINSQIPEGSGDGVYVDYADGVAGTAWPIGTAGMPVSNLTDALAIQVARKVANIYLHGYNQRLPADLPQKSRIIGTDSEVDTLDLYGFNIPFCYLKSLYIHNTSSALTSPFGPHIVDSVIDTIEGIASATLENCEVQGDITVLATKFIYMNGCIFPDNYPAIIHLSGNGTRAYIYNGHGKLTIANMDNAAGQAYIVSGDLVVTIAASCTAGTINVYGNVTVTNNANGTTVNDYSTHKSGKSATFTKNITSAANATYVTVATIKNGTCQIDSITLRSNGATTTDLTSAGIYGGTSYVVTFLSATDAVKANIDATDEQVSWTGAVTLKTDKTIKINLVGTGATAVNFDVDIGYKAITEAAYLN